MMTEIRFATVSVVNHKKGTVKAVYNDLGITTPELIVFQGRNKGTKHYSMPEIGENGLCLITETGRGYYLGSGYDDTEIIMDDAAKGKHITLYPDGTQIEYDESNSTLSINCKNEIKIKCRSLNVIADEVNITAKTNIKGPVNVQGAVSASEDVIAGNISLKKHKTKGVKAGNDVSGPPE
ncbi:hypothetical protein IX317_002150 [Fusobacterium sp. DD29]|uniref:phage baseplate assembly protein V n=1 Tax=unclassified Fusobacterium TaxID=2648384 RepID=UPI001B8B7887|nr:MULTISPECIES: phage baseplate assembly protein V [unclassified Fusobacterium]MBR8701165.1 hypothetical protein [Fusobacterium sp. DD45]MBR8711322.1 hypothetical protein [Fusobacterium sp. DD28]MBR8750428.1 hypothetical protein [Fusobacterium sp. DD29]MBR8751871.1 hypothetical protein [Fusobacterium sp. DD26]MBR8762670.1 hypothetical protein [Fusobacterium sp. DD25]